jgi:DNA-binding SARP family transcriptional activator/streptogramin lyase
MALSFRILGPLEVRDERGELSLGSGRQRALLALLLVHANELVSTERLIEELWSGPPPASAQKALQGYVSQLRRALGADSILTRGSGYVLVAGDTDADEFERLTRLASEQDAGEAVVSLERALALWRGRAFEEFEYEEWAQLEIGRLAELRLAAIEQRIDAELELGRHAQLIPELETLVSNHPLREQLRGQLMVALYRSGRHADALDVYRRGRRLLHDELGLEPSPFLAELERQILSHDATLTAPGRRFLPVGTVTFLFTDVEGSTRLLRQLGERFAAVLAEQRRILRSAVKRCEGREVDNQGDSFFFAFSRAGSALAAAVVAQRELAGHEWPEGVQVRVRMGLHTGEPAVGEERYVGLGVHRAARIGAVGHGGQVLLSNATRELVEDEVGGVTVRELGLYRLKDIDRPERLFQLDIDGLQTEFPPLTAERVRGPRRLRRRLLLAGVAVAVAVVAGVAAAAIALSSGDSTHKLLPNSVIRVDPETLKATEVAEVGTAPDLVVASGGYLWITNNILRDTNSGALRNAGDRTLTRVDPTAGTAVVVGGGLAPCGITPDPSGDVWIANCYPTTIPGLHDDVVQLGAKTLAFKKTLPAPGGHGFFRGLAYGGGSLWLSQIVGGDTSNVNSVTEIDPDTGDERTIDLTRSASVLAWSGEYGELWINNFDDGSLTRLEPATGATNTIDDGMTQSSYPVVDDSVVWVGDWAGPQVGRLSAVGTPRLRRISLTGGSAGVWAIAVGAGAVWATTPRDGALWRVDSKTSAVTRVNLPYQPTGVTADANNVWVTVRGHS